MIYERWRSSQPGSGHEKEYPVNQGYGLAIVAGLLLPSNASGRCRDRKIVLSIMEI
jgi:hypothetical protein